MIRFSVARLEKEPIELVGSEPAEFLEIESSSLLTVAALCAKALRFAVTAVMRGPGSFFMSE